MFPCTACRAQVAVSAYLAKFNYPVKCQRCGASYHCDGTRVSPDMHSISHMCPRLSPWMPTPTRPVDEGYYDCRFRHTGDRIFHLWWNGSYFMHDDERVSEREFLTWRGAWA